MGNLHKWFKGSKSKDGKSGWVNVVTGGTCASDEPGEGTPKCVSSSKRASMTPSERKSAARRKKAADPGQQQKSGAAKPTYVSTDKPKKMKKEQFSNWRDDYVATEHEFIDIIKPEPMEGIGEEYKKLPKRKMGMKAGKKIISAVGHAGKAGAEEEGTIEDQIRRQKADKKGRQAQKIHDIAATHSPAKSKLKNIRNNLKGMTKKDTKKEGYDPENKEEKWPSIKDKDAPHKKLVKKPNKKYKDSPHGDFYAPSIKEDTLDEAVPAVIAAVGKGAMKMATNMAKAKAKDMAVDKIKSMASKKQEVTEEDKKGAGSGKKDACYHKVKASAKVWPSAYASGRLVQCRKKGASNYGSGSKNEEFSSEGYKGKHGQSDKEYMDSRSDAGKQISGDSKMSGAAYSHRSFKGQGEPAKPGERQKAQGKMTPADRDELAIRKAELKKREEEKREKKKEKVEEALKCWKGYKRKKGATPGAPGSCVKEEKKPMPIGKMVRKAKGKVEKYQDLQSKADSLRKRAKKDDRKAEKGTRPDAAMKRLDADDRHSSATQKERKVGKLKNQAIKVLETAKKGTKSERFSDWRGDLNLMEGVAAWQRKEGKNKEGGLNEKGRKSYERENPGSDLKAPQPEGGSRKKSFCARMSGMKKKLTSKKTANDPDSRINKSLRKWKC